MRYNSVKYTIASIVGILNANNIPYGIEKYDPDSIRTVLRDSWYVDKVLSIGHTDCVYIKLNGSFIAILEDGTLMTGSNAMIGCCFDSIIEDLEVDIQEGYDIVTSLGVEIYESGDDNLVLFTLENLTNFFGLITNLEK